MIMDGMGSGAGTGGLTRQLVPMLQATLQQAPLLKYVATDVTQAFGPNLLNSVQLHQLDFKVRVEEQRKFTHNLLGNLLKFSLLAVLVAGLYFRFYAVGTWQCARGFLQPVDGFRSDLSTRTVHSDSIGRVFTSRDPFRISRELARERARVIAAGVGHQQTSAGGPGGTFPSGHSQQCCAHLQRSRSNPQQHIRHSCR